MISEMKALERVPLDFECNTRYHLVFTGLLTECDSENFTVGEVVFNRSVFEEKHSLRSVAVKLGYEVEHELVPRRNGQYYVIVRWKGDPDPAHPAVAIPACVVTLVKRSSSVLIDPPLR